LLQRHGNDLLTRQLDLLRQTVRSARQRHPFRIHVWIVLPEHLHCVIELSPEDADFATLWRLIKVGFSKAMPRGDKLLTAPYAGSPTNLEFTVDIRSTWRYYF
jgi:putative transposase